jgi:hypothetical protein
MLLFLSFSQTNQTKAIDDVHYKKQEGNKIVQRKIEAKLL